MKKLLCLLSLLVASVAMGQSCTTPFTDNFTGTGALGSQWTTPISTGAPNAVTKSSGSAVSSGSGIALLNNYCGVFPAAQRVTSAPVTVGNYSGLIVRSSTSGNAYAWVFSINQILKLSSGGGIGAVTSSCPSIALGQQGQFDIDSGFTLTCKNVTTGVSATATDSGSSYASGYPGLFVWNGFPLGPTTIVSPMPQAVAPTFSPAGPRLPTGGASITIACPTTPGASPFYSTNGTTPTTAYTAPVAITVDGTTLKAVCKASGYADSDVTSQAFQVGSFTWYVRTDGGTRYSSLTTDGQCDGLADVAYPGSGVNQHCAFNDYRMLYQDGNYNADLSFPAWGWLPVGGDTIIIRGSIADGVSWRVGWPNNASCFTGGTPNRCWGLAGDNSYSPPPVPSGTASHHTRILGGNYAACTSATARTQLHGGFGLGAILNLNDSSYVDAQCLDITDFSACGRRAGEETAFDCQAGGVLKDYAGSGIALSVGSTHITLSDISAHGLSDAGIKGAPGDGFVATDIKLLGNAEAGFDGDNHTSTTGTGSFLMQSYEISWNGCIEEYPIVDSVPYEACRDQGTGGYGDGFGTTSVDSAPPGWNIVMDQGVVSYNTQDGLDALHVCCSNSSIIITRTLAYGNEGAMFKVGGANATVQNDVINGNCEALTSGTTIPGRPVPTHDNLATPCRQAGVAVYVSVTPGYTTVIQDNTVFDAQAAAFEVEYATADHSNANKLKFDGNNFVGFFNVPTGENPSPLFGAPYDDGILGYTGSSWSHNSYFGYRGNWPCPAAGETSPLCIDQQLVDMTYHVVGIGNMAPASGSSPIVGTGVTISGLTVDFNGTVRPDPPSRGAYEFAGGTPTAQAPTLSPGTGYSGTATTITISTATTACTAELVYNTTGAQTGGNLTGTTTGTSYALTASGDLYAQVQSCPGYLNSSITHGAYTVLPVPAATGGLTFGGTLIWDVSQ